MTFFFREATWSIVSEDKQKVARKYKCEFT